MKKKMIPVNRAKFLIPALALLLVSVLGIRTVVAFLSTESDSLVNAFIPGEVTTEVMEDFSEDRLMKENVRIANTGNVPAYIRAAVVINWVDSEGNVSGEEPQSDRDYRISFPEDSGWFVQDGFYYFTLPVEPDAATALVISSIEPLMNKEGYTLQVDILGSGIQSMPSEAVEEVWPVTVDAETDLLLEGGGL